jgi:hypothetical protein
MTSGLRVRMYRTGFGDCFLLSLGQAATGDHLLIDFGAHMHGEIGTMDPIMDDIEEVTKKKLALIVASHAHRDHISGFGKFADRFAKFEIGEVWLPWTDNPDDEAASALQEKQRSLYDRLEGHLRLTMKATENDPRYAAALSALANLRGNAVALSALSRGFGTGAKIRYLKAGQKLTKPADVAGLSAEILGPPADKTFLSRMNPPPHQRFMTTPTDISGVVHPFLQFEMPVTDPDFPKIIEEKQPVISAEDLLSLHTLAEAPADRLALVLDSVRNNTSLVIMFRYRGKALLFPGDAQWGNWQSWIGTEEASRLLGEIDFLKVSHHGSDNATPVDVVNQLRPNGLAAMVSTQVTPYPTIPRQPLLEALEKRCEGGVVMRSDWIAVDGAPAGPRPVFPPGGVAGRLWVDYEVGGSP